MKLELIDIVTIGLAAISLAMFIRLQSSAFLYVFAVLIAAEAAGMFLQARKKGE